MKQTKEKMADENKGVAVLFLGKGKESGGFQSGTHRTLENQKKTLLTSSGGKAAPVKAPWIGEEPIRNTRLHQ